ncbi:hypothetical protein C1N87_30590 (plasmid) [Priestia aryabhattai]
MSFSGMLLVLVGAIVSFGFCTWYYVAIGRSNSESERVLKRDFPYEFNKTSDEEEFKEIK